MSLPTKEVAKATLGPMLVGTFVDNVLVCRQPCARSQPDDLPALSLDRNSDYAARHIPPQVQTVSAVVLYSLSLSISENLEQRLRCCKASSHILRPSECRDGILELVQCLSIRGARLWWVILDCCQDIRSFNYCFRGGAKPSDTDKEWVLHSLNTSIMRLISAHFTAMDASTRVF
jgi:hypothetical protein